MFEFTDKKPSSEKIWKEINGAEFPQSDLDPRLVKTILWILTCASKDFKQAKESLNATLKGTYPIEDIRQSFIQSIDTKYNVSINPVEPILPQDLDSYPVCVEELREPISIYLGIFKGIDASVVVEFAASIWPLTRDMEEDIKSNYAVFATRTYSELNPYNVQLVSIKELLKGNIRTLFPASKTKKVKEVESLQEIEDYIYKNLVKEVNKGKKFFALPTFKLKGAPDGTQEV